MFRFRSMPIAIAFIAAAGCRAGDAVKPEVVSVPAVGSVLVEMARIPQAPLSEGDTVTVRAIVRDTGGNLMSGIQITWELRDAPGETNYTPAGVITQTGPNTAVVKLVALRGVVVASAKGIFGELVLSRTVKPVTRIVTTPFLWSAERGARLIPVPSDVYELVPVDINDSGEVAGMILDSSNRYSEAFIWSEERGLMRFGSIGDFAGSVIVTGISAGGIVSGYKNASVGNATRAFVASRADGVRVLPGDSWIAAINDAGTVAGYGTNGPFRWSSSTNLESLPRTQAECTVPTDINNRGEILGWSGNELFGFGCVAQSWHVWNGTSAPVPFMECPQGCLLEMHAFNDLGIVMAQAGDTAVRMRIASGTAEAAMEKLAGAGALDLNEAGDIVGGIRPSGADPFMWNEPYVWTVKGDVIRLPLPAGRTRGMATAINNRGVIVGRSW